MLIKKFKAKISEINSSPFCLGKNSKDFLVDKIRKKTGLYGYVYGFSCDYDGIGVDDILDIHKYLIKKHNINNVWNSFKNVTNTCRYIL